MKKIQALTFQTIQLQKHDNDRLKTKLRWNEEENVKKDKIISQLVEEALVSDVFDDLNYQSITQYTILIL